jgi:hypothetical protein
MPYVIAKFAHGSAATIKIECPVGLPTSLSIRWPLGFLPYCPARCPAVLYPICPECCPDGCPAGCSSRWPILESCQLCYQLACMVSSLFITVMHCLVSSLPAKYENILTQIVFDNIILIVIPNCLKLNEIQKCLTSRYLLRKEATELYLTNIKCE